MSEGVEWAIHCVALLALLPEGAPGAALPAKALAEYHGVSESYLLKHLQALVRGGVLVALPGPKGGYRLARDADAITYLDIVDAVEGPEAAFRCTEIRQRGPVGADPAACRTPCAIHAGMMRAEAAWRESLRAQTIGDLVRHLGDVLPAETRAASAAWVRENARGLPMAGDG